MKTGWLLLLSAVPLWAAEYAVLENGFRLYAERHESAGERVLLYAAGGVTEIEAARVVAFEAIPEEPRPVTPPPPSPEPAAAPLTPRQLVDAAAGRHGLPAAFVHSVVKAESAYQQAAVSPKGALGLMQLMPGTALAYGADPRDPAQNVEAGVAYLRDLLLKFQGDTARALAAYNAGPGAVEKHKGIPPYRETRSYVDKVLREYQKSRAPGK